MPDRVVVDSSIAVKWYIAEDYSPEARTVLQDYLTGALELLAPDLIYAEFGNIIWKKRVFQGLNEMDADAAVHGFQTLPFVITPVSALLDDAYRLAVTYRRSVYDALYLALSQREGCQFVTADEKLYNVVKDALPNIVYIANWIDLSLS